MVTYAELTALIDALNQKEDMESRDGLQTVSILLGEVIEYRKQSAYAGMSALMASLCEELGEPVPEKYAGQLAVDGLNRIRELFAAVNVLLEQNEFACRFDLEGEEGLISQVEWLLTEMTENGMNSYLNRRK